MRGNLGILTKQPTAQTMNMIQRTASLVTSTISINPITIKTRTFLVESNKIAFTLKKINTGFERNIPIFETEHPNRWRKRMDGCPLLCITTVVWRILSSIDAISSVGEEFQINFLDGYFRQLTRHWTEINPIRSVSPSLQMQNRKWMQTFLIWYTVKSPLAIDEFL